MKNEGKIMDFEEEDPVVRIDQECKILRASCSSEFFNRSLALRKPHFSCRSNRKIKWELRLVKNEGPDSNYISLTLKLQSSDIVELEVFFQCSLKKDSEKIHTANTMFSMSLPKGNMMRIPRFIRKSTLTKKISQYKLSWKIYALPRVCINSGKQQLSSDLGALLQEATLADVTLVVAGKELRAHKAILSARSPVFARMFQQDMREARENRVCIEDVGHEVMLAFLRFAYTAKLEARYESMASDLIVAADKYQFEELRKAAANLLLMKLNVGNAIDTLQLAERYGYADLKREVIDFINKHAKQIVKTSAFKTLTGTQAHLIAEIYSVMAMAHNNNDSVQGIMGLGRY